MKKIILLITTLLCLTIINSQESNLIINNVNYIDVEKGTSKKGSILIENGKIKTIKKRIKVSDNVKKIDGSNKWLIPGLIDGHIHLFQTGGVYTRPDVLDLRKFRDYDDEINWVKDNASDLLKRYLRLGITSVIDPGGPFSNFKIRDSLKNSQNHANLFLSGPLVSTYQPKAFEIEDTPIIKVKNKEEAIKLVQKQLPYKPDFIKIWYIVLPNKSAESTYDIIEATIKESHRNNLKVAVHATQLKTAKLAIKAGADILVHSIDEPIDNEFTSLLIKNKVTYIPTMMVHGKYIEVFSKKPKFTKEDLLYSNPFPLGTLMDPLHFPNGTVLDFYKNAIPQMEKNLFREDSIRTANLKTINNLPINIVTGTDAGNIGTLHASSFYKEIEMMKNAGITNSQLLKYSTINAARMLGKESQMGSITVGKIADFVLLNANPLKDINAIKNINSVIKNGNLIDKDSIIIETPEALVQQQLNAYNSGDIDAFLAPYSEDVEIYNFPSENTAKGKEKIRPTYERMFKAYPNLHCELVNRTILGNTIIDHERITGIPNMQAFEAIAIYKIKDNKIFQVYFID